MLRERYCAAVLVAAAAATAAATATTPADEEMCRIAFCVVRRRVMSSVIKLNSYSV